MKLMKEPITRGIITLTGHKNKILLTIDGILSLEILPTKQHGNICLYMKIRALHKFWDWPLDPDRSIIQNSKKHEFWRKNHNI